MSLTEKYQKVKEKLAAIKQGKKVHDEERKFFKRLPAKVQRKLRNELNAAQGNPALQVEIAKRYQEEYKHERDFIN